MPFKNLKLEKKKKNPIIAALVEYSSTCNYIFRWRLLCLYTAPKLAFFLNTNSVTLHSDKGKAGATF